MKEERNLRSEMKWVLTSHIEFGDELDEALNNIVSVVKERAKQFIDKSKSDNVEAIINEFLESLEPKGDSE